MPDPEGWTRDGEVLTREFEGFPDFDAAFAFADQIRELANQHDHHPDLTISWGRVRIRTTTHDAGNRLTDKDFRLAEAINELSASS